MYPCGRLARDVAVPPLSRVPLLLEGQREGAVRRGEGRVPLVVAEDRGDRREVGVERRRELEGRAVPRRDAEIEAEGRVAPEPAARLRRGRRRRGVARRGRRPERGADA